MSVNNFDSFSQDNQASIQNLVNDYTVNEESFNKNQLNPQETAKIVGDFQANSIGKKKILATFTYNEAEAPVTLEVITEVIQVQLIGKIIKGLPKEVVAKSKHSIELLVKNNTRLNATAIIIDKGNLSIETIDEEDIEGNFIHTYTLEAVKDNLKANHQYRIKGTIEIPENVAKTQLDVLIKYDESKSLTEDADKSGLSFNTLAGGSTTVVAQVVAKVGIEGNVTPTDVLRLKLNQAHQIQFTFKNKSFKYPATNILITISEEMNSENLSD